MILGALSSTKVPISAALLLVIAVMTKSAQFPFSGFLPDAAQGPEPAVALLHCGSLAISGAFVAILLMPIIASAGMLQPLIYVGLASAVIGTVGALRSESAKRVLSYSTIQGLGIVFVAIGENSPVVAVYFIFAQCFGRALLFMIAAVSQKATGKDLLSEMGGLGRNRLVCDCALRGAFGRCVAPFGGFFAFQGVFGLASALNSAILYSVFVIIAFATGLYAFRWFALMTRRVQRADVLLSYDAQPKSINLGLAALAIAAVLSSLGFFILPSIVYGSGLGTASVGSAGLETNALGVIVGIAVSVSGCAAGFLPGREREKLK